MQSTLTLNTATLVNSTHTRLLLPSPTGITVNSSNTPIIPPLSSTGVFVSTAKEFTITTHFTPDAFKFFFGESAIQDINSITIQKSELLGLTPALSNSAESLFVALINRMIGANKGISFLKLGTTYWGYGYNQGKRTDTILIDLFNIASYNGNLLIDINYNAKANPNNY
jgi:hypothetical protein